MAPGVVAREAGAAALCVAGGVDAMGASEAARAVAVVAREAGAAAARDAGGEDVAGTAEAAEARPAVFGVVAAPSAASVSRAGVPRPSSEAPGAARG